MRLSVLTTLLLFGLFPVLGMAQSTDDFEAVNKEEEKALKRAVRYLQNSDFHGAKIELQKAAAENPSNPFTMFWLGKSYFETREPSKAWPLIDAMMKVDPNFYPEQPYIYARLLHKMGRTEEAKGYYKKAIVSYESTDPLYAEIENYIRQCEHATTMLEDTLWIKVNNLGEQVNTPMPEYAAVITPNDSLMFFTSRRWGNLGGVAIDDIPFEDIYMAKMQPDGSWGSAQNLGKDVNYRFHDGTNAISPEGDKFYMYRSKNGGGIFVANLKDNNLVKPVENIGKPIKTKYYEPSAVLNETGGMLFFSREAPGGYGGLDLYWATRGADGEWSAGRNMGPVLNSPFDDDAPFLWADGKTLFFASKGHDGYGGFDIFKTTMNTDSSWTKPINVGYPINSTGDDIYFTLLPDSVTGYFTSDRMTGRGEKDIYRFKPNEAPKPTPALCGTLVDSLRNIPLGGEIRLVQRDTRDTIAILFPEEADGYFAMDSLKEGMVIDIFAGSNGYYNKIDQVTIGDATQCTRKVVTLSKQKMQVGQVVVLNNVFFDFDKASLRPISKNTLENVAKLMKENPGLKIRINGHTDHVGTNDYNQKLSEARAKSVVSYLMTEQGISKDRLDYKGFGEEKPLPQFRGDLNRQRNRRVEMEVLAIGKSGLEVVVDTTTRHCYVNAENYGDIPGVQRQNVVSGKVVLSGSNAPLSANIRVYDPKLNLIVATTTTNPKTGYYTVQVSPGVKYRIEASASGTEALILNVDVPARVSPQHTELNFQLKSGNSGRISMK